MAQWYSSAVNIFPVITTNRTVLSVIFVRFALPTNQQNVSEIEKLYYVCLENVKRLRFLKAVLRCDQKFLLH